MAGPSPVAPVVTGDEWLLVLSEEISGQAILRVLSLMDLVPQCG